MSDGVTRGECESCGDSEVPIRSIKMKEGGRERLCEECFEAAADVGKVDPSDPRLQTRRGGR